MSQHERLTHLINRVMVMTTTKSDLPTGGRGKSTSEDKNKARQLSDELEVGAQYNAGGSTVNFQEEGRNDNLAVYTEPND
jgi:hypothetical protein